MTRIRPGGLALGAALLVALLGLAAWHVTQGTTQLGVPELLGWLGGERGDSAVIVESRLPRVAAAIVVGLALGAAGYAMQTITGNPLASPDTLAVNGGAGAAIALAAVFGVSLPGLGGAALAFGGGIVAALAVVAIGRGRGSTTQMVLVGTALALALQSVSTVAIILAEQETAGLYAWGVGRLSQNGIGTVAQLLPVVLLGIAALLLLARRLDVLSLGEEAATTIGVGVGRLRFTALVASVALAAAAVAIAGPIGFVGLAAPIVVRLLAARIPGAARHIVAIPLASLTGAVLVVGSDVLLRFALGGIRSLDVPTGVVTSLVGAVCIIVLARSMAGAAETESMTVLGARTLTARAWLPLVVAGVLLAALAVGAVLLGDRMLLLGDVANWLTGRAGDAVRVTLDTRSPRVVAAVLAGVALALSGALVQAIARNALADPYLLGVAGGAGLGAIGVITLVPAAVGWAVAGGALAGGAAVGALVIALVGWQRLGSLRLVLTGLALSAGTAALTSMLIVVTDPYNRAKAIVWLAGSTYGRGFEDVVPVAVTIVVAVLALAWMHRDLDLAQLDEATPRLLGVRLPAVQVVALVLAVALASTAVAAIGVVAFVGLVAPHAARALVGARHRVLLPLAALLGGSLTLLADTLGRTLIAPAQLPAGVMTALVGIPYFIWLVLQAGRAR
ncbi:iron ABC transporter permease [Agrococcus sp. Marseille-Q4369]|uniref:iron ABC transporter permease n=1 Tax=Agrococcus sp. Marseille-Q4369 TaxID=2810513 RepID=UPI001B8B504F|nr:iron ABC transporter permease [Agrococcus sp. Marseille-Q4369]QUW19412.1 iron ABC transporter permease [Agrococcus sp. Marseille-Q4369]